MQLAAALLEYDNDPDNPQAPKRSAQESAIFSHLRRYLPSNVPRQTDYLGVALSGDEISSKASRPGPGYRQSRVSAYSVKTLHNPFKSSQIEEEDENEETLEVDFSSWGLDAFIPKDKDKITKHKSRRHSTDLLSVRSHQPLTTHATDNTEPRPAFVASRSMSFGNLDLSAVEVQRTVPSDNRRRSMGTLMQSSDMKIPPQRRRASSYTPLADSGLESSQGIPFPVVSKSSTSNKPDPGMFSHRATRERLLSNVDGEECESPYKDAQLDSGRQHVTSDANANIIKSVDENPFVLEPPSHTSRFDPKATTYNRTMSNASMVSRPIFEEDIAETQIIHERDRRYSTTVDLLRPKVLVMPSPLQAVSGPGLPSKDITRDGFELSTDGPPLPPGARSTGRASTALSTFEPPSVASNSFTPNPLASLSLSQVTFRNTLRAGNDDDGRDGYDDRILPRATEDGQQVLLEDDEQDDFQMNTTLDENEILKGARPPGKLYGKSLIDDLEERKAQMRNKQRVFAGDERPSMMVRGTLQRTSTLIDPTTLRARPPSGLPGSHLRRDSQEALKQGNSSSPLVNFENDNKGIGARRQLAATRSVFGVDTLWEREMAKLRDIEAQEKAEEVRQKEEVVDTPKKKKKKHKRKDQTRGTTESVAAQPNSEHLVEEILPKSNALRDPPVLPDIQRSSRRPPPQMSDNNSESEVSTVQGVSANKRPDTSWHAISSDEDKPRKTTGVGLRNPGAHHRSRQSQPQQRRSQNDSDEDVPLSIAVQRIGRDTITLPAADNNEVDSDDERPLSTFILKQQPSSSLLPDINFDNLAICSDDDGQDDDDQPLGLRASRISLGGIQLGMNTNDDDDDRPLAYHPEQQRRQTQYQMLAQAQAQQQQFMLQAQMQNSVYLPPMMAAATPTFFAPSMMPMMMQPAPLPPLAPSPPPMRDEAKFGRVDQWRRNVAIEGDS